MCAVRGACNNFAHLLGAFIAYQQTYPKNPLLLQTEKRIASASERMDMKKAWKNQLLKLKIKQKSLSAQFSMQCRHGHETKIERMALSQTIVQ